MRFLLVILLFLNINLFFAQDASKVESLDNMIVKGMEDWKIPGLATIVVKDGQVVFKKTYGVRNIDNKEAVDGETLFNMASTTKAIVAMALGILVDQGRLNWDDKVQQYLPDFKLSDNYIAADARVGDLLTHNLGVGNADMLWIMDSLSTKETLKKFRYAKTTYPLRGGFEYQNLMYAVAGKVIEAVSGKPWTIFVDENIFAPLGMDRSQTKSVDILKVGNYVSPHFNEDGKAVKVKHTFTDQIGAAGMIWSSIDDIEKYLQFILNEGKFDGKTIISKNTFQTLFEPKVILNSNGRYPTNALTNPNFNTYAYGWFQQDYRGKKLNFHTGSLFGLIAIAGVMPEENMAVYVFANMDHAELRHAIMYKALDLFGFDDDSRDWHDEVFKLYSGFKQMQTISENSFNQSRVKDTKPTLKLDAYEGEFSNEMLGTFKIQLKNGKLYGNMNELLEFGLDHWHYNTFMTEKMEKLREKFPVVFQISGNGNVSEVEIAGETFTR
ncbi:CubicO group peptidase, beta-lactamase class C family [Flavobacteriaceae bacterium MAR_2010_188]|nr:CubicO group peptidase, beta-lactamase class C family [Flavobacteriaceae bacterium MAR_2010_188]